MEETTAEATKNANKLVIHVLNNLYRIYVRQSKNFQIIWKDNTEITDNGHFYK